MKRFRIGMLGSRKFPARSFPLWVAVIHSVVVAAVCPAHAQAAGAIDSAFRIGEGPNSAVHAVTVQPQDNKVLIGGDFSTVQGLARNRVCRLFPDGRIDTTFNPGVGALSRVSVIAMQTDGRILLGGSFFSSGQGSVPVVRAHPDGSRDSSFELPELLSANVKRIWPLADGRIYLAGNFNLNLGGMVVSRGVIRLNADGSLDEAFDLLATSNFQTAALHVLPDGKLLAAGFSTFAGGNKVIKLLPDGSLDPTFSSGSGFDGQITTMAVQLDGKMVVSGHFSSYNGVARGRIARINADGSLDLSFDPGAGFSSTVTTLVLQPNNRILAAGFLGSFNGRPVSGICRLHADGRLDTGFKFDRSLSGSLEVLTTQFGNKLLVGGFLNRNKPSATPTSVPLTRLSLGRVQSPASYIGTVSGDSPDDAYGRVTMTLGSSGAFSGSLVIKTERWTFRGFFDEQRRSTLTLKRRNEIAFVASIEQLESELGFPVIQGELHDLSSDTTSRLRADPPHFNATTLPSLAYRGRHNVALTAPLPSLFPGATPVSGAGYVSLRVGKGGTAALAGRAGDGSVITASARVLADGELLVHWPLYKGQGFLNGSMKIEPAAADSVQQTTGQLLWHIPVRTNHPVATSQTANAQGTLYTPAPASLPPFGTVAPNAVGVEIGGGHLPLSPLPAALLSFSRTGRSIIGMQTDLPLDLLKLTVNRTAGTFSGSFLPFAGSRAATIRGIIVDGTMGYGHALVLSNGQLLPSTVFLEALAE